jgi:ATP-dependent DNA helicase RecQ
MDAHSVLRDVFGYSEFRAGQEEIIDALMGGENLLAVMPTGAGKSLCYQIPALLSERLTVVVSPLLALMDDQVETLRVNGVGVVAIHSGASRDDNVVKWKKIKSGECKLLYLSPERLMTPRMLDALGELNPVLFVVDEAHCISKWGASFRPEYEQLSRLTDVFPGATIAAFTATADKATRSDIATKLFRGHGRIIVHGFDRPNLRLAVATKADWKDQLMDFLADKKGQPGIIYCLSRKFTDEASIYLIGKGLNAIAYHAGQTPEQRKINQDRFMSEDGVIMVATIAFGMGIDKADIRYVCHLNLPGSIEAYYQEIGRAGRDGEPAETMLLYGLGDMALRRQFIEKDGADDDHKRREHKRLDALLAYCEAAQCRRAALLAYFDETSLPCGNCDNCLNPAEMLDGTQQARMLLSTVARTGQAFGAVHIIGILRGANSQKIRERRHHDLPTHGAGKDQSKEYWQSFIRQTVAAGYLSINVQKYGGLEMTARGRGVLNGEEPFLFREISKAKPSAAEQKGKVRPQLAEDIAGRLSELKKLRLELARERKVAAYIIFADSTLIEMARQRPRTLDQMASISGVGPKKLREFGPQFLRLASA